MTKKYWIMGVVQYKGKKKVVVLRSSHVLREGERLTILATSVNRADLELVVRVFGKAEIHRRCRNGFHPWDYISAAYEIVQDHR